MGYPKRLLSEGEEIAYEFRPHWSSILKELSLVLFVIVLVVILARIGVWAWVNLAVGIGALALVARGLIRWLTTLHVVTNERVIYRIGLSEPPRDW